MDDRHESIRSETWRPARPARPADGARAGAAGPSSTIEDVPGYAERRSECFPRTPEAGRADPVAPDAAVATFGGTYHTESAIGADDRVEVKDVGAAPFRSICALRIVAPDGRAYSGTGWFASAQLVVTAGHCVYFPELGAFASRIEVISGLSGTVAQGRSMATRFRAARGFAESSHLDYDYGAILLDEPLGEAAGALAYAAPGDDFFARRDDRHEASIAGYPVDYPFLGRQLAYHARPIVRATATRIFYAIDTYGGQSGSPIYVHFGDDRIAIGIHTMGDLRHNSGTRITADVFQNLVAWQAE